MAKNLIDDESFEFSEGVAKEEAVVIDTTLSVAGQAADSKEAGDAIRITQAAVTRVEKTLSFGIPSTEFEQYTNRNGGVDSIRKVVPRGLWIARIYNPLYGGARASTVVAYYDAVNVCRAGLFYIDVPVSTRVFAQLWIGPNGASVLQSSDEAELADYIVELRQIGTTGN